MRPSCARMSSTSARPRIRSVFAVRSREHEQPNSRSQRRLQPHRFFVEQPDQQLIAGQRQQFAIGHGVGQHLNATPGFRDLFDLNRTRALRIRHALQHQPDGGVRARGGPDARRQLFRRVEVRLDCARHRIGFERHDSLVHLPAMRLERDRELPGAADSGAIGRVGVTDPQDAAQRRVGRRTRPSPFSPRPLPRICRITLPSSLMPCASIATIATISPSSCSAASSYVRRVRIFCQASVNRTTRPRIGASSNVNARI